MANKKLDQLTELTTVATDDLLYVEDVSDSTDQPEGTGKKITMDNLVVDATDSVKGKGLLIDGQLATKSTKTTPVDADEVVIRDSAASDVTKLLSWSNVKATLKTYFDTLYQASDPWLEDDTNTWTYASTTTFTIPTDVTDDFYKGLKLKLTNDSQTKYFYVTNSAYSNPNTTVTVTGETDLASGAITDTHYSYMDSPPGFKRGENWYFVEGTLGADQTIADETFTTLDYESTTDTNGDWNDSTNTYTAPITGKYFYDINILEETTGADITRITTQIAGDVSSRGDDLETTHSRGIKQVGEINLDKGDQIYFQVFADVVSGSPIIDESSTFKIHFRSI